FFLFFFFSSRRRHTRSKRDWSSDVCSSDLLFFCFPQPATQLAYLMPEVFFHRCHHHIPDVASVGTAIVALNRSRRFRVKLARDFESCGCNGWLECHPKWRKPDDRAAKLSESSRT